MPGCTLLLSLSFSCFVLYLWASNRLGSKALSRMNSNSILNQSRRESVSFQIVCRVIVSPFPYSLAFRFTLLRATWEAS